MLIEASRQLIANAGGHRCSPQWRARKIAAPRASIHEFAHVGAAVRLQSGVGKNAASLVRSRDRGEQIGFRARRLAARREAAA
jgi:hypothetical protein